MFLRIKLENSNEVLEIPFADALSRVRLGEAKFIPDDLIDGKSLNDVFFGINVPEKYNPFENNDTPD